MSASFIGLIAALAAVLWYFIKGTPDVPPASVHQLDAEQPADMPDHIWKWAPLVKDVAREIGYPYNPAWALATVWDEVEETGSTSARGARGEVGLMQVTQGALDDVWDNMTGRAERVDLPKELSQLTSAREQLQAGMLYHALNAKRCRGRARDQIECTIRAHNGGPPPNGPETNEYWRGIRQLRSKIPDL